MKQFVKKARDLMYKQTLKNRAPAWKLTEIAIEKGKKLSKKYKVREDLVLTALYLAHTKFSTKIKGHAQMHHEELSAHMAEKYLTEWKVPKKDIAIILNAIRAHHNKVPTESKEAEVMKNAECYKFLTVDGALIYLDNLGKRNVSLANAIDQVKFKAEQKLGYVTLPDVKKETKKNYKEIIRLLKRIVIK